MVGWLGGWAAGWLEPPPPPTDWNTPVDPITCMQTSSTTCEHLLQVYYLVVQMSATSTPHNSKTKME